MNLQSGGRGPYLEPVCVVVIDCTEYPCVVYGQRSSKNDRDKLRDTSALAPYLEESDQTSVWHSTKEMDCKRIEQAYFGVAYAP